MAYPATLRQSLWQAPRRKAAVQRIRLSSIPSASSATVQLKLILNPVDGLLPQGTRQAGMGVKKPRAERGDTFSIFFCGYQRILPGGSKTNLFRPRRLQTHRAPWYGSPLHPNVQAHFVRGPLG